MLEYNINQASKSSIIIELTIPYEQNINSAHNRKLNKYAGLTSDLREQGYRRQASLCRNIF